MAVELLKSIYQNFALYVRAAGGLMISLPIIFKTVYLWGQVMRDREYKDVLKTMKEISEKNKDIK